MKSQALTSIRQLGIALAIVAAPVTQASAAGADRAVVDERYQADRQACMQRADPESQKACLREAGAARQEALRGTLGNGASADEAQWQRNALSRCEVHSNAVDRSACERMVMGQGESKGSVEGGGMVRQIITVLPPDSAMPQR